MKPPGEKGEKERKSETDSRADSATAVRSSRRDKAAGRSAAGGITVGKGLGAGVWLGFRGGRGVEEAWRKAAEGAGSMEGEEMKFEISGDVTHIPERRLANPFARDRPNNVKRSKGS